MRFFGTKIRTRILIERGKKWGKITITGFQFSLPEVACALLSRGYGSGGGIESTHTAPRTT